MKEDETARDSEGRRDGVEEKSSREAVCSIVIDEEWAADSVCWCDAVSIGESEGESEDDANDFEAVFVGGGVTDFVSVLVGGGVFDGVSENEFSEREEVGVF